MIIKSVIKKEETIEKEVTLPYFCKIPDWNGFSYLKIMENESVVKVDIELGMWCGIKYMSNHTPYIEEIYRSEEISEGEFNQAYHEALMEIGKYVPAPEMPVELK